MPDPTLPPSNDNHHNGNQPAPPTSAPLAHRLPQDPTVPAPPPTLEETLSPGMKRDIRRAFLILLGIGLAIGMITAAGVVWVMDSLNLIGTPEQADS